MINQRDARKIAQKLDAPIRPGRKHDIAVVSCRGKVVAHFGIRRASTGKPHPHIARQLYISHRQAQDLADCPLTAEAYFRLLVEKRLLPED